MGRWHNPGSQPITIRPLKMAPIVVAPGETIVVADSLDAFIKERGYYVRPAEASDDRKPFTVEAFIAAVDAATDEQALRAVPSRFAMPSQDAIPKKLRRKINDAMEAKFLSFAAPPETPAEE